jgi:prephenate dehydrogenase
VGCIEDADGVGEVGNVKCGDIMKIYLKIEDNIIKDVKFETFGCGSAIASSSISTEMIMGKTVEEALALSNKEVVDKITPVLEKYGVTFIGAHPMAGREFSGFEYSLDNLFDEASFIITPSANVPQAKLNLLEDLIYSIHFKKVVFATPEEHDQIIAFTSQLAHVVSNAYIKSPTNQKQLGFSAGSFQDLTRVAKLNEVMWTPLFMLNKEPLCFEIDYIIKSLTEYRDALMNEDNEKLKALLRDGRILKENSKKL